VKVENVYTELFPVEEGAPQGNVLLLLHNLPISTESTTAKFADDTAVLATDSDPAIASQKLQT
jgi:hypothetical protein